MPDHADSILCNEKRELFIQPFKTLLRTLSRSRPWKSVVLGKVVPWFPHWDLGAWGCPLLTDRLMKQNRSVFFTAICNSAAIFWTPPRSTDPTRMKNYWAGFCAKCHEIGRAHV